MIARRITDVPDLHIFNATCVVCGGFAVIICPRLSRSYGWPCICLYCGDTVPSFQTIQGHDPDGHPLEWNMAMRWIFMKHIDENLKDYVK